MNSSYTLVDGIRFPSTSYHAWLRSGDDFQQLALDCGSVLWNGEYVAYSERLRLDEEQEACLSETSAICQEVA